MRLHKFKPKYLFAGLLTAIFFTQTWKTAANYSSQPIFCIALTAQQDTVPRNTNDTLPKRPLLSTTDTLKGDSLGKILPPDSSIIKVDTFDVKLSKDTLDAPVEYEAEDSMVVLVKDKKVLLYGKTKTIYKDIELTAPMMEIDQQTQILTAVNGLDSAGNLIDRAHFRQADTKFQSDTIRYNFKTQKGLTKNTHTVMGEGIHVQGDQVKRVGDIIYSRKGVLTTCMYDDPHFGFRYDKVKMVNNKVAITGPIHPEFEGVPIPIYLPFGFFPMKKGRHSGLLAPQFTANEDFGLGLEGLGYYKTIGEHFDVTVRTNIYSYGGWTANIIPTYHKRYRYQGQLQFTVQSTKYNFKGDPDYIKNRAYSIVWSHSTDPRSRPGTTFNANVNAGSTTFNTYVPNDPRRNFQNQLGSSITYTKAFKNSNLSISANHNQNNSLHLINLNLPDIGYTVNTLYPFQRKEMTGATKWYEKLGVAYNGTFKSQVSFYDTAFRTAQLLDTLQWGGQHNFPITLSLPPILGGKFLVSPNVSYENKWIAQKLRKEWNPSAKKVDSTITKGFYTDHKMSFGIGINTALYGTFSFKGPSKTQLRHVIRPTLSFSYSPSFSKSHWHETQIDTLGRTIRYSEYEGSLYGFYGEQDFGGMSFGLDNNLEMKRFPKKDTALEAKKIRLIDGFGFNGGYNFIADSLKLSPISFYFRSTLFEKINITAGTTLNPYQTDSNGYAIDKYAWEGGKFRLGRFTTGNLSMSTDFRSKPRDEKKEQERKMREEELLNDPLLGNDVQSQLDYMRRNPADFVDFNIPWSISLGLSVFFSERLNENYKFEKEFSSNLNFNGSFSLTPKWNFAVNGYYDFDTRNLQTFTMSISREMHCWQMAINVTPVGPFRYFNFTISPKSGLLQDLKINRTRYFYVDR